MCTTTTGYESDFRVFARFWFLNYKFSPGDIGGIKVENFTDTESTTRLEFKYQTIAVASGLEYDLIHCLFVRNLSGPMLGHFECFRQRRGTTGARDV